MDHIEGELVCVHHFYKIVDKNMPFLIEVFEDFAHDDILDHDHKADDAHNCEYIADDYKACNDHGGCDDPKMTIDSDGA